jgi:hypothetical protein
MIEQNQGDCKGLQRIARALVVAIVALVVAFLVGVFWAGRASAETPDRVQAGVASWYGYGPVACPGRHSPAKTGESGPGVGPMTAAHKSLPCGTRVRVTTRDRSGTVCARTAPPSSPSRIAAATCTAASSTSHPTPRACSA